MTRRATAPTRRADRLGGGSTRPARRPATAAPAGCDADAARAFLGRLYAPWLRGARLAPGVVTIAARRPSRDVFPRPWIAAAFPCDAAGVEAAVAFAAARNASGCDVYARPMLCRAGCDPARVRTGEVIEAAAVFADLDDAASVAALDDRPELAPSFLVETGSRPERRAHAWWMLAAPAPAGAWLATSQALAAAIGGDDMVADVRTLARVPGLTSYPKAYRAGRIAERVRLGDDTGARWIAAELRAAAGAV